VMLSRKTVQPYHEGLRKSHVDSVMPGRITRLSQAFVRLGSYDNLPTDRRMHDELRRSSRSLSTEKFGAGYSENLLFPTNVAPADPARFTPSTLAASHWVPDLLLYVPMEPPQTQTQCSCPESAPCNAQRCSTASALVLTWQRQV
jgi:hypothetical protein